MRHTLELLLSGQPLSEAEAQRAFKIVLSGEANEVQVGAMLALLQSRGVTLDELVGGARVMREHVTALPIAADDPLRASLIDTCGTGGAAKTFNVSTAVAIVAAACRTPDVPIHVAKHGGKSRTGRGSAEVLETLGVNIAASPKVQARCLRETGICFSFAIHHHPAMKFAAGPRKSLGFPTIFNLLGPLTNPAGAERQLMGLYDPDKLDMMAEALRQLGATRAMVVHSDDGLDELSTVAPTTVVHLADGVIRTERIDPASYGFKLNNIDILCAHDVEDAAQRIMNVLMGELGPHRNIVLLNAGAALVVAGACESIKQGVELASGAIDRGDATRTLDALARLSHEAVSPHEQK